MELWEIRTLKTDEVQVYTSIHKVSKKEKELRDQGIEYNTKYYKNKELQNGYTISNIEKNY